MQNFNYRKATSLQDASADFRILAGGTTLIDLMKLEVETPRAVLDINGLALKDIKSVEGGIHVGALVKNAAMAHHELIEKNFPVLSQAILAGASAQLRNKADDVRKPASAHPLRYFRDPTKPCNKREANSGCPAIEGPQPQFSHLGHKPVMYRDQSFGHERGITGP